MTSARITADSATEFVPAALENVLGARLECPIVRFYDQVPGAKALERHGIESKLAPSFLKPTFQANAS
ncbi:hypothetical protein [Rhodoferax sp.]|uniref:hypothetical protein n=1 Tax=Rhodoferax sp. TaxID=50421 RepID=UPI0025D62619|nr:hypothetical protein [Rhodoferax sp.]